MKVDPMRLDEIEARPGVYVVAGDRGTYLYKGCSRNIRERLNDHLGGKVARTHSRRPLEVVYVEYAVDYSAALRRERWLKSGQGRKWLVDTLARVVKWQTQGT